MTGPGTHTLQGEEQDQGWESSPETREVLSLAGPYGRLVSNSPLCCQHLAWHIVGAQQKFAE